MARINDKHGGKRANAGRKSKAEEAGLAGLLDRVWTTQDREDVIRSLHARALDGNERAASLLLAYAYGKPPERIQHENPDGSPLMSPVAEALIKIYGANPTANNR